MKTSQKGFVAPLLLALIAILLIGGGAYVYVQNKTQSVIPGSSFTALPTSGSTPLVVSFKADTKGVIFFGGYTITYGDSGDRATSCGFEGTSCPSHTYTQPGIYTATLYGTGEGDGGGVIGTVTITVK